MTTGLHLSSTDVLIACAVLVVLGSVWRAGARQARAAERAMRGGSRLASLTGRVLFTAALIVGVQWGVIATVPSRWALLAVLGVPALFSAYALTRALTAVSMVEMDRGVPRTRSRGGRR